METLGWISGLLLAFCGLPEAIRTVRNKKCGVGWMFLLMWYFGEIGLLAYTLQKVGIMTLLPSIFNYVANIFFISIMIWYKLKEK